MPKPWKCSSTSTVAGIVWAIVEGTYAMARPADDSGVSDTLASPAPLVRPSIGIRHWPSISCANAFQATSFFDLSTGVETPGSLVSPRGSPAFFGSDGVRASAQPAVSAQAGRSRCTTRLIGLRTPRVAWLPAIRCRFRIDVDGRSTVLRHDDSVPFGYSRDLIAVRARAWSIPVPLSGQPTLEYPTFNRTNCLFQLL